MSSYAEAKLAELEVPKRRKGMARSAVSNGRLLPGIDGRSMPARRYRDIAGAIISDQGGTDQLAEVRLQLIRRFAASSVMAEHLEAKLARGEQIDIAEHAFCCSTLTRIARLIGVNRQPRDVTPSLAEYLEQRDRRLAMEPSE